MRFYKRFYGKCTSHHLFRYGGWNLRIESDTVTCSGTALTRFQSPLRSCVRAVTAADLRANTQPEHVNREGLETSHRVACDISHDPLDLGAILIDDVMQEHSIGWVRWVPCHCQ